MNGRDPVTDWFFRSSLHAGDGRSVFACLRPEGFPPATVWWITYAIRWKRASDWAGPDAVFTFALDAGGQVLSLVPADSAFAALKAIEATPTPAKRELPDLSASLTAALAQLKATVSKDTDERHLTLFPLLLIHWRP